MLRGPDPDSRAGTSGAKRVTAPSGLEDRHVCERRKAEPFGESTVLAPPGDGGTAAARARARLGR